MVQLRTATLRTGPRGPPRAHGHPPRAPRGSPSSCEPFGVATPTDDVPDDVGGTAPSVVAGSPHVLPNEPDGTENPSAEPHDEAGQHGNAHGKGRAEEGRQQRH